MKLNRPRNGQIVLILTALALLLGSLSFTGWSAQASVLGRRLALQLGFLSGSATKVLAGHAGAVFAAVSFTVNDTGDTPDATLNGLCADSNGKCTLRAAIQEANNVAGDDTINFDATVFAAPGPHTIQLTGALPDLTTSITINGPGASILTVRRNTGTPFRIFTVTNNATVSIAGLTAANGFTPIVDDADAVDGGGIFNGPSCTLTLTGVVVSDNQTGRFPTSLIFGGAGGAGGGIRNHGSLTMNECRVSGNSTSGGGGIGGSGGIGGGIHNTGVLTMDRSAVSNNTTGSGNGAGPSNAPANGGHGGRGGGISSTGTLTVTNSTVSGNTAGNGGAANTGGRGGNGGEGGGIHANGTVALTNVTISGNRTGNGGNASPGSQQAGNAGDGGGINTADNASVSFTSCTITANTGGTADTGGGGGLSKGGGSAHGGTGNPVVRNTIIAGNSVPAQNQENLVDVSGSHISQGFNLIGVGFFTDFTQPTDQIGTFNEPLDPKLNPLGNYGGPTQTHSLRADSPALDRGDDGSATPTTDQRGETRPFDYPLRSNVAGGDGSDTGAFELNVVTQLMVNSLGDTTDPQGCDAAHCTLREAINSAASSPGFYTISFSVTGTINLTGGLPNLPPRLQIAGPGANLLTVRRDTGGTYRIFSIPSLPADVAVGISGLTISNGRAPDPDHFIPVEGGGGILNKGNLLLSGVVVSGNQSGSGDPSCGFVNGLDGTPGGGINNTGTLTMTNSTVSNNETGKGSDAICDRALPNLTAAANGGHGGGIFNSGTLTITNSTISGNRTGRGGNFTAPNPTAGFAGDGGGIYNTGTLNLTASTVSGNRAGNGGDCSAGCTTNNNGGSGGGIRTEGGTANIRNSTITDNHAGAKGAFGGGSNGHGGGSARQGGTVTVRSTIIAGNTVVTAGEAPDAFGTHTSQGFNLVGINNGSFTQSSDQKGTLASPLNPRLGPLAANGGPTQTHALLPGSPAVDRGDDGSESPTTDQRGQPRPFDQPLYPDGHGDASDVGAYEATAPLDQDAAAAVPAAATGYNFDLVIDGVSPNPADTVTGTMETGAAKTEKTFFERGHFPPDSSVGLPMGTLFASEADANTFFRLQPAAGNNALLLDAAHTTGTLTLNVATAFTEISLLTASTEGAGTLALTVNFADGTPALTGLTATSPDWFFQNPTAIGTSGRRNVSNGDFEIDTLNRNPRLYQIDVPLPIAAHDHAIASISFSWSGAAATHTAVFALSGVRAPVSTFSSFVVNTTDDTNDGACDPLGGGGADCTLREAITLANSDPGVETITFTIPGAGPHTINLTGALPDLSTPMNIVNASGEGVTVRRDTGGDYRILTIGAVAVTLEKLTLINGNAISTGGAIEVNGGDLTITDSVVSGNSSTGSGGGINLDPNSVMTMTRCVVSNNRSGGVGGGFRINAAARATVFDSVIRDNSAESLGGGICGVSSTSQLTIMGSTISGNSTLSGDRVSVNGGGVYFQGTLNMTNCTVSNNSTGVDTLDSISGVGGGLYITANGPTTITNCTITGNQTGAATTNGTGGGIFVGTGGFSATIRNTIIAGNSVPGGGSGSDVSGPVTSSGYNLVGKRDGSTGFTQPTDQTGTVASPLNPQLNALANNGGPTDTHSLKPNSPAIDKGNSFGSTTDQRGSARAVDLNDALYPDAAGGDGSDIGAFETQTLPDSTAPTVAFDDGDADDTVTTGATLTYTVAFSEDIEASTVSASDFNNAGTATIIIGAITETTATSGVFTVQVTPTTTGTIILRIPSGAVISDPAGNNLVTPVQDDTTVTVNPPDNFASFVVTKTADTGDGACDSDCSLREAITAANSDGGAEMITFTIPNTDAGCAGGVCTIQLTGALPNLSTDMTIQGPGARLLTVRRDTGGNYRIFTVPSGVAVNISGLTLTNGRTSNGAPAPPGGGILNSGTLTLIGVAVSGNQTGQGADCTNCTGGNGGDGGGINNAGTLTIINSTVSGNQTGNGGNGIAANGIGGSGGSGGGINNAGTLTITNSTISGNQTGDRGTGNLGDGGGGPGGGINSIGTLIIANSTITANTAIGTGGGIDKNGGTLTIRSTIVAGNTAPAAPDVDGVVQSDGYNLIGEDQASGGFTQPTDLKDVNAQLGTLANNGGPTDTHSLKPNSPALDKGKSFGATTDQRGFTRPVDNPPIANAAGGDGADIGAFEAHYALAVAGGTPQSAVVTTAFTSPLMVTLTESGNPASGVTITFTAPVSGASATFPNGNTAMTNASGGASVNVAANSMTGSYQAMASASGVTSVAFNLTNLCAGITTPQVQPVNPTCNGATNGSLTIQATGGITPLQYSIDNGQSFSNSNQFTGLGAGTYNVVVRDANGCASAVVPVTLTQPPALTLTPTSLPSAPPGTFFTQTLTAGGGTGNKTLTLNGTLPGWLNFNAQTGTLSGTPPQTGAVNFSITARDQNNCTLMQSYVLNILSCQTITLTPASLPGTTLSASYSQTVSAAPAGGNYSYSVSSGALPTGLMLNSSTGEISGTPAATGNFSFTIRATGSGGCTGSRNYTIVVGCPTITLDPPSLAGGTLGNLYTGSVSAAPAGTYNYTLQSGALPGGLSLNATTGAISGTPTATGTFNFIVKATSGTCSGSRSYTITIACPTITFATPTLPAGELGMAYSQTISVMPSGAYSFSIISGSLPGGMTLNATTGAITGTPAATGTFTFTIKAQQGGCSATQSYSLVINCPTITVNPTSLPNGRRGSFYNQALSAAPASGTYNYAVTAGALPNGLNLNPVTGALTGTPTVNGFYPFTIRATRAGTICTGSRSYTVMINNPGVTAAIVNDYDGDGRSDFITWNEDEKDWLIVSSRDSEARAAQWKANYDPQNDQLISGDYDGDGKYDLAIYRHSTGEWLIKRSTDGVMMAEHLTDGIPVPADYDGDSKTDLAVWQSASGRWTIRRSSDGREESAYWGSNGDVPIVGDYDGDGKADLAVYHSSNHRWQIKGSSDGLIIDREWGLKGDLPLAADYDGDGKTDLAVWRAADNTWHVLGSRDQRELNQTIRLEFHAETPLLGDYDGDGKADLAIRRGEDQGWRIKLSGVRDVEDRKSELEVRIPMRITRP